MTPDPASGRWLRALAIAAFVACGVATCARSTEPARSAGKRIITIGGAVTETVFALGHGAQVVAVDTSSVFPPEVARLPQVGYQRTIAAETVLSLSPDLVVASAEAGPPAALAQLRSAGIAVEIIPVAMTPEAAAVRIAAIGAAIGAQPAATELANRVRSATKTAVARCCTGAPGPAPKAILIYARGAGTMMVAGTETAGAAMLELAGARNPVTFSGFKPLSAEALVEAAPDVIVIPSRGLATLGGEAGLLALPGVAATPAGRARRFVAMDDLLLLGFGPRLGEAVDELASRLAGRPRS
jgi:iron complex transport system substrate-binding protein